MLQGTYPRTVQGAKAGRSILEPPGACFYSINGISLIQILQGLIWCELELDLVCGRCCKGRRREISIQGEG